MPYEKPNYTQTPNAFFDYHLSAITSLAELKVTLLILRRTLGWHTEQTKLSLSGIEQATGLTRKSATAGLRLALERGTVTRQAEGQSFVYEANITRGESTPEDETDQGKKYPSTRVKSILEVGEKVSQSPSSPILVKESIKKGKKGVVLKPPFHGKDFLSTLADFESHRKELKKPLKDTSRKLLYGKLRVMGEDVATQAMQESITNGWQGVFEPRSPRQPTFQQPEEPEFRPDFETFLKVTKLDPVVARETYDNSIWGSK